MTLFWSRVECEAAVGSNWGSVPVALLTSSATRYKP